MWTRPRSPWRRPTPSSSSQKRRFPPIHRHEGRILPHPNTPELHEISPLHVSEQSLSVQGSSFRPHHRTASIHQSSSLCRQNTEAERCEGPSLPRRLANPSAQSRNSSESQIHSPVLDKKVRYIIKFGKIPFRSGARDHISGNGDQHSTVYSTPHRKKGAEVPSDCHEISQGSTATSQGLAFSDRYANIPNDVHVLRKAESKALSDVVGSTVGQNIPTRHHSHSNPRSPQGPPSVVDMSSQTVSRSDISTQVSQSDLGFRCLKDRMGIHLGASGNFGEVVCDRVKFAHKCVGTESHPSSSKALDIISHEQDSGGLLGQHDSPVLYKERGRNQVSGPVSGGVESVSLGRENGGDNNNTIYQGTGQCPSRSAKQGNDSPTDRVDSSERSMPVNMGDVGKAKYRPVCNKENQKATEVLLSRHRQGRRRHRRVPSDLGQSVPVCTSTHSNSKRSHKQTPRFKEHQATIDSTLVASKRVVPRPVPSVSGTTKTSTSQEGPVASTSRQYIPPPDPCLEVVRVDFVQRSISNKGFSVQVAKMAAGCHKKSTTDAYQNRWKLYREWCGGQGIPPSNPSIINLADFFVYLYESKKLSPSAIKGYRSMLVSSLKHTGLEITNDHTIQDIFRSIDINAPRVDRSLVSWNLNIVLQYLMGPPFEPLARASAKNAMRKALFLMILATSKRVGETQAYSNDVGYKGRDMILSYLPGFRAKTETEKNKLPRFVQIPSLDNILDKADKDRLNCPVRALKYYLDRFKDAHNRSKNLFCPFKDPSRAASKNAMSYMVRMLIKEAHKELDESGSPCVK